uniref:Large ribosomal subunit protein uL5c n=1 Tax=Gronococcus sybilensis TaxID=3028029 RepID=A0A9Y1I2Q8_9RHOD|nr:ribosomal protein L5 [Gronococcus sybilensis]
MNTKLHKLYKEQVIPLLTNQFNYKNIHEVPKLTKVKINRGLGEASQNSAALEKSLSEISIISGQKAVITKAQKSVAGFKLREGMPVGVTVTLRNEKMYIFLEKLINLAFPRIRDFRGINPKSFDGRGNYNLGIREQLIFPEIEFDQVDKIRGADIAIVTTAQSDEEGRALLKALGMPFREN